MPTTHRASALSTPDRDAFTGAMVPGAPAADAPVESAGQSGWLLDRLGGRFELVLFDTNDADTDRFATELREDLRVTRIRERPGGREGDLHDAVGLAAQRYDARPGTAYLLRPDQHVAARWRAPTIAEVRAALKRAQGH